jgi:hypothetical protein
MSTQPRVFGTKTFDAIGCDGTGLSVAYGFIGTEEEHLRLLFAAPAVVIGS